MHTDGEGRERGNKREREGESTTLKMLVLLETRFSSTKPIDLGLVEEIWFFTSERKCIRVKY